MVFSEKTSRILVMVYFFVTDIIAENKMYHFNPEFPTVNSKVQMVVYKPDEYDNSRYIILKYIRFMFEGFRISNAFIPD